MISDCHVPAWLGKYHGKKCQTARSLATLMVQSRGNHTRMAGYELEQLLPIHASSLKLVTRLSARHEVASVMRYSQQPPRGHSAMQIEFFWDPGSTNTYFAWHLLKPIAAKYQAEIVMQPFNLGYVFRHHNYVLMDEPATKMQNRKRDLQRWAARYELPFQVPDEFPIKTSRILRGSIAARNWQKESEFIEEIFHRYWETNDASVAEETGLAQVAKAIDIDSEEFLKLLASREVGQALIESTSTALERGVFGAPSFIIDDELYWGKDRMEFIEDHLASTEQ